jgi:hypothetical protein
MLKNDRITPEQKAIVQARAEKLREKILVQKINAR